MAGFELEQRKCQEQMKSFERANIDFFPLEFPWLISPGVLIFVMFVSLKIYHKNKKKSIPKKKKKRISLLSQFIILREFHVFPLSHSVSEQETDLMKY